jgi:hypothetical protein
MVESTTPPTIAIVHWQGDMSAAPPQDVDNLVPTLYDDNLNIENTNIYIYTIMNNSENGTNISGEDYLQIQYGDEETAGSSHLDDESSSSNLSQSQNAVQTISDPMPNESAVNHQQDQRYNHHHQQQKQK